MIISAFAALVGGGGAPRASIEMGKMNLNTAEHIWVTAFPADSDFYNPDSHPAVWQPYFSSSFGASENTNRIRCKLYEHLRCRHYFRPAYPWHEYVYHHTGFAKTGMLSVLIGAVMNIVLDPLFIFAFHMGVRGAALATILSQAVSCIWVLSFLCGKKTILHILKKNLILKPEIILPCVALGLATFIMQASESIISVCFNSSLLKYGGDIAVGAMTILTSVMQFAMLPLQGLGQGAQPVLSYNYGAKNGDRVKKAFRLLLTASLCYSTLLWAFIMLFPQVFAEMFTSDSALLGFTKSALRIYCACLLLFGIQIACQMAFTSFGKAKASIAVAVTRKFILLLPLIYLLPHILTGDKTNAVYMAEPIADFLAVSFTTVLFTFQFRKVLKELEG